MLRGEDEALRVGCWQAGDAHPNIILHHLQRVPFIQGGAGWMQIRCVDRKAVGDLHQDLFAQAR